jgi:hypothetical protein
MISSIAAATTPQQAAPCTFGAAGLNPQERLLALMVYSDLSRLDSAKTSINVSSEQLNQLYEEARKALAKAREAQEHSGFWGFISKLFHGDIATLAEVVAVAAAAVATGGTATIVLAAIAAGATLGSKYADQLGIPPELATALGIAAGIASVASGNLGGASALTSLGEGAQMTSVYFHGVAAGAEGVGAVAHGVSGHYAGEALDYKADSKELEDRQVLESSNIDESLDQLQAALERQHYNLHATNQALQLDHQSAQQVLHDFSGAA